MAKQFWGNAGTSPSSINLSYMSKPTPTSDEPTYPRPVSPVPLDARPLSRRKNEISRYPYLNAEGRLLYVAVEVPHALKGKAVIPWTWCEIRPGVFGWAAKGLKSPHPLYGLDRLAKRPGVPVIVVEGAKTADAAQRIYPDHVVVTSGSASSADGADWSDLQGREVTIVPDADKWGFGYAAQVETKLRGIAKCTYVISLPAEILAWVKPGKTTPGGWDLADPVPEGVNLATLLQRPKPPSMAMVSPGITSGAPEAKPAAWIVGDTARMLNEKPVAIRWLLEGLMPVGDEGLLAARAGLGKSSLALNIGMVIAAGGTILGRAVGEGVCRGVVFAGLEDHKDEFHRRFRRCLEILEESTDWSPRHLELLARRFVALFPNRASGETFSLEAQWRWIAEQANAIPGGCGLIILDTLARMVDGDENSARDLRPFNESVSALAQATGATVLSIHHVGKGHDTNSDKRLHDRLHPEALRGSSALEGAARFVVQMAALSPAEAQAAGLDIRRAQRGDYVALNLSKMNSSEKGGIVLLERRAKSERGAGFLTMHPESDDLLALILGGSKVQKLLITDHVILVIANNGSIAGLDVEAESKKLWPDAKDPKNQWSKQVSALRKTGLLQDDTLTPAGRLRAESLGLLQPSRAKGTTPKADNQDPGTGDQGSLGPCEE